MSDLKERLRRGGTIHSEDDNATMAEALDRIEALETALRDLTHDAMLLQECIEQSDIEHDTNWLRDTRDTIETARETLGRTRHEP